MKRYVIVAPKRPSIKHSNQIISYTKYTSLESRQYSHNYGGLHQSASHARFIKKTFYKFPLSQPIVEGENVNIFAAVIDIITCKHNTKQHQYTTNVPIIPTITTFRLSDKGTRSRKNPVFSIFIYFCVIFFFCHINILLLSICRPVCFIHINKFSKCYKNEHL